MYFQCFAVYLETKKDIKSLITWKSKEEGGNGFLTYRNGRRQNVLE